MSVNSRRAAAAAALLFGAGIGVVAVAAPATAAPASHSVTYSPGLLPVLGALGITIVPGISPTISAPDGGAVHTGDSIIFKTTGSTAVTVTSTTSNWSFSVPLSAAKPARVTVPAAPGTYGYGVGNTKASFAATSPSADGTTQPSPQSSGGGNVLGLSGGQQPTPPAAASGGSGAPPSGSGAAGSAGGASGAGDSTGSNGSSGSFDKARFGTGSGDFPSLPGGMLAPLDPQPGSAGGAPAPEIAGAPSAGSDGGSPATTPRNSTEAISNASQVVGSPSSSSVTGPAAAAAALLALVAVGLSRAWINQRPLGRH